MMRNFIASAMSRIRIILVGIWPGNKKNPPKPTTKKQPIQTNEDSGQWYFKRDILDRLEHYLALASRLRKRAPEAYALYAKLGAAVLPSASPGLFMGDVEDLHPRWRGKAPTPAFGATVFLDDEPNEETMLTIRTVFFFKLAKVPPTIEPHDGPVYEVGIFYHTRAAAKKRRIDSLASNFYCTVKDGVVTPLRIVVQTYQKISHRDKIGGASTISHTKWSYGFIEWFAKEFDKDMNHCAQMLFHYAAWGYECASSALRISASRGGVTAFFGIDLLRTPYFFRDRDVTTLTASGTRKKIFHIVRTFRRSNGSYVKSHFRGERSFVWNGFDVKISMPGHHIPDLLSFDLGATQLDDDEPTPKGMIGIPAAMTRIAKEMNQ